MSDGMSRLKGLALGLGDEIEAQNDQIDRINREVGTADVSIQDKKQTDAPNSWDKEKVTIERSIFIISNWRWGV